MEFQVPINIKPLPAPIKYGDKILLIGSCFTEHIGNHLQELKFDVLQNPHGILFDPQSVANSLVSYIQPQYYKENDLLYLNELWQSWQHHSIFSNTNAGECLKTINNSQDKAGDFLQDADWIIITLGSSFSYRLSAEAPDELRKGIDPATHSVANCHRAPAQVFDKHLMTIEEINSALDNCIHRLFLSNRKLKIIFTVSPVRHIRDGVVENNRSKARLIEVVHHLVNKFDKLFYFPAYELVIDVLRDYRFYDLDMAHPNYQATAFVMEKFIQHCIAPASQQLMEDVRKLIIAKKHRPFQPDTNAHRRFLQDHLEKAKALQAKYDFLDLKEELKYFSSTSA